MDPAPLGVVGCGAISDHYLTGLEQFDAIEVVGCADLDVDRAEELAAAHDVPWAGEPEDLLAKPDVEVVLNLTPAWAHATATRQALEAGKHVYTEKPLAATVADAEELLETAAAEDLRIGCAPDTLLGRGVQTARRAIDAGRIGDPIGATAFFTSGGNETFHDHPETFYREGGGPLFDMGPYYVGALATLLGPAERVAGSTSQPFAERTIRTEARRGETFDVAVPTHETGIVDFASGATATLLFSWDAPNSDVAPQDGFEIQGTEGVLRVPDPNHFEGAVEVCPRGADEWEEIPLVDGPTSQRRGLGVVDLVRSLRDDEWTQRTSGEFGLHVLETMAGLRTASEEDAYQRPSGVEVPPPLPRTIDTEWW